MIQRTIEFPSMETTNMRAKQKVQINWLVLQSSTEASLKTWINKQIS